MKADEKRARIIAAQAAREPAVAPRRARTDWAASAPVEPPGMRGRARPSAPFGKRPPQDR